MIISRDRKCIREVLTPVHELKIDNRLGIKEDKCTTKIDRMYNQNFTTNFTFNVRQNDTASITFLSAIPLMQKFF